MQVQVRSSGRLVKERSGASPCESSQVNKYLVGLVKRVVTSAAALEPRRDLLTAFIQLYIPMQPSYEIMPSFSLLIYDHDLYPLCIIQIYKFLPSFAGARNRKTRLPIRPTTIPTTPTISHPRPRDGAAGHRARHAQDEYRRCHIPQPSTRRRHDPRTLLPIAKQRAQRLPVATQCRHPA